MDVYKNSACKTREMLVDIIQEYPDEIEHTYIPSCVVLMRCAGCCNDEALECVPTETRNVTMEVRLVQSSACCPSPCFLWLHACPTWGQWGGVNWHVSYVVYRCTLCLHPVYVAEVALGHSWGQVLSFFQQCVKSNKNDKVQSYSAWMHAYILNVYFIFLYIPVGTASQTTCIAA